MTYYTHYIFTDTLTNKIHAILANSETNAWIQVSERYGSGYVFENFELTATAFN